jgi:predicted transcriptional regulator YdeE
MTTVSKVMIQQAEPITIVGIGIKTSNANAMNTIPQHWGKFMGEDVQASLGKLPVVENSVYAVYTDFQNEGVNNEGDYHLIIGLAVSNAENVPEGFVTTTIHPATRYKYDVPSREQILPVWMQIWQDDIPKSFICDYEKYENQGQGAISIHIGIKER